MSLSRRSHTVVLLTAAALLVGACGEKSNTPSPSQPNPTYAIRGAITAGAGATVRVAGAAARTSTADATGSFSISGLPPGAYTVTPAQEGSVFDPVNASVTLTNADVASLAFSRREPGEGLSADQVRRLDAEPDTYLPGDKVILPNGQTLSAYAKIRGLPNDPNSPAASTSARGARALDPLPPSSGPQQKKNDVVALMLLSANDYACGRPPQNCTKWDLAADPADIVNRPAQKGLSYVWGGRTPTVRTLPGDGCPQLTKGVDCSGLILNVARAAGLAAPATSTSQAIPNNWTIPADWKLKMKLVTDGSIESGDLVAWPRHIGIASSGGTTASATVISSTGGAGQCESNIKPPKGPRPLTIAQLSSLGAPTSVLRLVTTLSGDFDAYIRCTDQATDAATIRFKIDNDQGGRFRTTGTGKDYNGTPLSFVLDGSYNQISNVVEATLSLANGSRSDAFTQKLLNDDTGYFPLAKVVSNGGCSLSARLVRVASPVATTFTAPAPAAPHMARAPSTSLVGAPPRP